jgi:oxygen-independent coproporphyrinogen-3 oxidase
MTVTSSGLEELTLAALDPQAVLAQHRALAPPYDVERWLIPLPVWATRPYDHDGAAAWEILRDDLDRADPTRAFCIYLHVPFCSSKCHFCDCYSFRLGDRWESKKEQYVEQLCAEIELWSAAGNLARRPVSTVHLGGGTPTFLGEELLTRVIERCRACFRTSPDTEWALESSVQSLSPGMIAQMQRLGFRRLHIGVQSLEDRVRAAIGRRRPRAEVLERLRDTLDLGWVVSVDMVCGLPLQTVASFINDIETLLDVGVDGVALYELLIYPQNRRWAEQQGLTSRSHLPNYVMFQAAAQCLERRGYRKNTFNHWANGRDDNRYFTFPTRGEDCLALGTIADGVFGDYHFRHPRYAAYLRAAEYATPGLEGGLRRTAYENAMQPITTAIMSGDIGPDLLPVLEAGGRDGRLRENWLQMRLVEESDRGGLSLTTNGSWFAGNMIKELTGVYPEHTQQR